MNRSARIAVSVVVVIMLAWTVWQATMWGRRSGLFPMVIGVPVLALAVAQLMIDAFGKDNAIQPHLDPSEVEVPREVVRARTIGILATILGFSVAIWAIGFIVAIPLVTFLYLKLAAAESWRISIVLSVVAGASFYGIFVIALGVPAPPGAVVDAISSLLSLD